jgi:Prp8 binding protein
MEVSPNGHYLCTNGMDNTIRLWDIRSFAHNNERQLKVLYGAQHNFEKNLLHCAWSPDGRLVAAGSADRFVYVWDTLSGHLRYKLPGHQGSVNDVDFHPREQILLSCSSDKTIYLGELQ